MMSFHLKNFYTIAQFLGVDKDVAEIGFREPQKSFSDRYSVLAFSKKSSNITVTIHWSL